MISFCVYCFFIPNCVRGLPFDATGVDPVLSKFTEISADGFSVSFRFGMKQDLVFANALSSINFFKSSSVGGDGGI